MHITYIYNFYFIYVYICVNIQHDLYIYIHILNGLICVISIQSIHVCCVCALVKFYGFSNTPHSDIARIVNPVPSGETGNIRRNPPWKRDGSAATVLISSPVSASRRPRPKPVLILLICSRFLRAFPKIWQPHMVSLWVSGCFTVSFTMFLPEISESKTHLEELWSHLLSGSAGNCKHGDRRHTSPAFPEDQRD